MRQGCSRNSRDRRGKRFEAAVTFERDEMDSIGQRPEGDRRSSKRNVMTSSERVGERLIVTSVVDGDGRPSSAFRRFHDVGEGSVGGEGNCVYRGLGRQWNDLERLQRGIHIKVGIVVGVESENEGLQSVG